MQTRRSRSLAHSPRRCQKAGSLANPRQTARLIEDQNPNLNLIAETNNTGKPASTQTIWYPPRVPGQPANQVRAIRPRGIAPGKVCTGDRFGRWTVKRIRHYLARHHGFPCRCMFGLETPRTCPEVCYPVTRYEFDCRCDCGTVRTVRSGNLLTGNSLSCGCGDVPLGVIA